MNVVNRSVTIKDKDDDKFSIEIDNGDFEIKDWSGATMFRLTVDDAKNLAIEIERLIRRHEADKAEGNA